MFYRFTRIVVAVLVIPSLCVAEDAWTQFGGPYRNYQFPTPIEVSSAPTKRWQRTLGEGMSSVVAKDGVVYASYLVPFADADMDKKESERTHREAIIALDAGNGKKRWCTEYDAGWLESQQAFGGRSRAPQATPTICGDVLISIGFTGILHCVDRTSGDVIWKKNVVATFDATPVQFGFSASPVPMGDHVVVLVGGKGGGLVCLDVKTGRVVWNVPCNEASYATPVIWDRTDGKQIVFVTRNRVVGVTAKEGRQLWEYELPGGGLTNVPTPLPLDDSGLLISGQGVKGTKRLNIVADETEYQVTEAWSAGTQFFYCNWTRRNDVLWGCDGNLLIALDLETGERIGRFRGYNDANLLLSKDQMFVYHGDGHLSELKVSDRNATVKAKYSVLDKRAWTPCTPNGNFLYCRAGDQLLCLDLVGGDPRAAVVRARIRKQVLDLGAASESSEKVDPIQEILSAYEASGQDAAWKAYQRQRDADPDAISFEQRSQLAKMANDEGLHEFAKLLLQHAAEDFPQEAKDASKTPSSETTRGGNGLVYLEFGIRNSTEKTIQAYVKGPTEHPFSYGLPLRPGKVRLEKWPIGTKLYRTESGISKEVLLTVESELAGKTVDVP